MSDDIAVLKHEMTLLLLLIGNFVKLYKVKWEKQKIIYPEKAQSYPSSILFITIYLVHLLLDSIKYLRDDDK